MILKQTRNFRLTQTGPRFYIRCLAPASFPRGRRIGARDAAYLAGLRRDFDAACVLDFGVGVFAN